MNEESKINFPQFVYSMLREMNKNAPEVPAEELARRACMFVPAMLVQVGFTTSVDILELQQAISNTFQAFRNKPAGLTDDSGTIFDPSWLDKVNRSEWKYWPNLSKFLGEYLPPKPRSPESIAMLDVCSDDVLRWAGPPDCKGLRKGLVLGYIQSGKTQNFTALISKAADCGYKLIIVLSGIDNELRKQTQIRIKRDILGSDTEFSKFGVPFPKPVWRYFTDENNDFREPPETAHEILESSSPCCLVVKKHAGVLQKVFDWLNDEKLKQNPPPTLIIDDEADQASPNSNDVDDYEPTKINGKIRLIISLFESRCRYVAYTATPFANFFINPEVQCDEFGGDLFPEHFLRALPLPKGYVGTADIYGLPKGVLRDGEEVKAANICRTIEDTAEDFGNIHASNIPKGLYEAVLAFYIGTAVLVIQRGNAEPSTMLVHVSHLNEDQNDNHATVVACLEDLKSKVMSVTSGPKLRYEFENLYVEDFVKKSGIRSDSAAEMPSFMQVWEEIERLLNNDVIEVRVVNGQGDSAPDFESPESPDLKFKGILVGGNLLSRGLTLKNLLVSYFLRKSSQADTMLQMARWLGYRRDYLHLMRVYNTLDSQRDMEAIAAAEQDVRNQIKQMDAEGKTPREFSIRVRIRKGLIPTARKKMINANYIERKCLASSFIETLEFPESDTDFNDLIKRNDHNQKIVKDYLSSREAVVITDSVWHRYTLDGETAVKFIDALQFDKNERHLGEDITPGKAELLAYISSRQKDSELSSWDIILCSLQSSKIGPVDVIPGIATYPIERGREMFGEKRTSCISNLCEGKDEYLASTKDDRLKAEKNNIVKTNGTAYREIRDSEVGRIFIYPISAFSNNPNKGGGTGKILFANPENASKITGGFLLGFGISFPGSKLAVEQATNDISEFYNKTKSTTLS
jgi:Z1 domain